jgi:hypothetical protein
MTIFCYAKPMTSITEHPDSWTANYINHAIRLVFVVVTTAIALVVYRYLLKDIITGRSHFLAYLAIWLFSAYVVLPRLNRWLSKLYLPDYFIGRATTGDGLLADPVNLAIYGTRSQLTASMIKAGWTPATKLSLDSSLKMIYSALRGSSYPDAPVSSLFLFRKRQDLAFEKDIDGTPRKRHHVRLWKTPASWWLPGGYQVDWLGAATFDEHVGLSLFTGQITHKVDANVDKERDFLLQTLRTAGVTRNINIVKHFTTSYHGRNGGGDKIHTDGDLPFITL